MKTILLYGFLGRQFGRVHKYDVASPAEAVRALCATIEGFRKALTAGGAYRVAVGQSKEGLAPERLGYPVSDRESIRLVPVMAGAGRGLGQIILGAALIYFTGGLGAAFGASAATATSAAVVGFAGITSTTFAAIGTSLLIGGVSQMLFAPKASQAVDKAENKASYSFDGAVNTVAQGNAVPVFYGGPLIIGSQVISAGLSVEQI